MHKAVQHNLSSIKNLILKLENQLSVPFESLGRESDKNNSANASAKEASFISTSAHDSSLLNSMNLSFLNYLKKILLLITLKVNGYDLKAKTDDADDMDMDNEMSQNIIWSMVKDIFLVEVATRYLDVVREI